MPSTQDLRRKIKSIKATGKLTRAMQMVAASKMNKATAAAVASRAYSREAWTILGRLAQRGGVSHPLFDTPGVSDTRLHTGSVKPRRAIIAITSNRGLAGSLNSALVRLVSQNLDSDTDLIVLGRKGAQYLRRFYPSQLVADFPASDSTPSSADATPIASLVIEGFITGRYERIDVVYTHFVSTLANQARSAQLLPILPEENETSLIVDTQLLIEPDPDSVLDALAARIVPLKLYQFLLESSASEHSARMLAMKSATDNAGEIVNDLTLTYQGVRQANITREIIEVSAGANALSSS